MSDVLDEQENQLLEERKSEDSDNSDDFHDAIEVASSDSEIEDEETRNKKNECR